MTTINVKEIEELSAGLRLAVKVGIAEDSANALDALLAFYKESIEQEPVAWVSSEDLHLVHSYGFKIIMVEDKKRSLADTPLYAHPPASAARIAELEAENTSLRFALADTEALEMGTAERCEKQAEKLRIAREVLNTVRCDGSPMAVSTRCEVGRALAALGEE